MVFRNRGTFEIIWPVGASMVLGLGRREGNLKWTEQNAEDVHVALSNAAAPI